MIGLFSEKTKFSSEQEQMLQKLAIKESGPGSILLDFNGLLGFIKERSLPLSSTHQLPMRALPEINARMTRPLQHGLRRPQQKSYPHINGLYLLIRASGLTFVGGTSKQPFLFVDREVLQIWNRLNPTEQYFSLLETWLLRGSPEIIGETGRRFSSIPENFKDWMYFFKSIPEKGLQIADDKDAGESLRHTPGLYNFGLLELFGLISVQYGLPVEGKASNIELIRRTFPGDALLALLLTECSEDLRHILEPEYRRKVPFGVLQPILRPYFPKWKNNLSIPEWVFREGVHIFKVSLGRVWFRIAMPADRALDALASAILDAVDFSHDHLYRFSYENRFGTMDKIDHPEMRSQPWTETERSWASDVLVGDLPLRLGQTMTYLYDFGDKWEFDVALEQVDQEMVVEKPVLLEIHGEPPEQYPRWGQEE